MEGRGEGEEKGKEGRREHPPLAGLSWAHGLRERTPPTPQQRGAGQAFLIGWRSEKEKKRNAICDTKITAFVGSVRCPKVEAQGSEL